MSFKSGNSIIPTDKQYDAYYAPRCERCGEKLADSECHADGKCEECLQREQEELADQEEQV